MSKRFFVLWCDDDPFIVHHKKGSSSHHKILMHLQVHARMQESMESVLSSEAVKTNASLEQMRQRVAESEASDLLVYLMYVQTQCASFREFIANVPIQARASQIAEHLNIAHKRIKDLEASTMGHVGTIDDGDVDDDSPTKRSPKELRVEIAHLKNLLANGTGPRPHNFACLFSLK
jgi:hypothetical protein